MYYYKIYSDVKSNFENYIYQSGLDEVVLENIVTQDQVKEDVQSIVNNIYDNAKIEIDTEVIKQKLNTNISNSLQNTKLTSSQQNSINQLVQIIAEEYTTSILHSKYESQIHNILQKAIALVNTAKTILYIAVAVSSILLLVLNLKTIYKFFAKIGIGLLSSGVFWIFVNFYINSKVKIQTISILGDTFSYTLRNVLQSIFNEISNYGWIFAICGIVLIIIPNVIYNIITKDDEK